MELIQVIIVLLLLTYIAGLLAATWMFNRQTKLLEEFKLDNAQLETENLTLKQKLASLTRDNREMTRDYEKLEKINQMNTKRIAMLNNQMENFKDEVLRIRNEVLGKNNGHKPEKKKKNQ